MTEPSSQPGGTVDEKTNRPALGSLHLSKGSHADRADGVCLMEAVAWWADKEHTDSPPCVSPVLRSYGIDLNDNLPDERRQDLKKYIPLLPGTADDGLDERRGLLALDWLIRVYTPAWLRLVPALVSDADALAGAWPIDSLDAAAAVGNMVRESASKAAAAWDAAGDAAWDAARAAAWDAAWAAARAAARDAAGAAAWAAARDAARDAAWDAAWAAARAAARDAAGAAAGAAARAALQPTVDQLQVSAIDLFATLIAGEVTS